MCDFSPDSYREPEKKAHVEVTVLSVCAVERYWTLIYLNEVSPDNHRELLAFTPD